MQAIEEYTVRLEDFQGPLDLLLYLARRAEVDVAALPIVEITDQFMATLGSIERIDIDRAGEFLVMAATLMELKSRLVSPRPEGEAPPEEEGTVQAVPEADDPDTLRSGLIAQLLAYKRHRDAADMLAQRAERWSRRSPVAPVTPDREALLEAVQRRSETVEIEDLGLYDMVSAYEAVLERVNFALLGAHSVALDDDDTPIEEHAADLVDRLSAAAAPEPLRSLLSGRSRGQVVGLFVATLELIRRGRVCLEVRDTDGETVLTLRDTTDNPGDDPAEAEGQH